MKVSSLPRFRVRLGLLPFIALWLLASPVYAESGTWLPDPVSNDWFTPANWSSNAIPNGNRDVATFGVSAITELEATQQLFLASMVFQPGASSYTISHVAPLFISQELVNLSGVTQNIVLLVAANTQSPNYLFLNHATVGDLITFTTKGDAPANTNPPRLEFTYVSSAGNGTMVNEGATMSGRLGGATHFLASSTAGNATVIAQTGSNGGGGGIITFTFNSDGGTSRIEVFGNGYLAISDTQEHQITIGSLEGDGQVYLGEKELMVGSNSLTTTFSGVLHPESPTGDLGTGKLVKIGDGSLTLTGASLYTGGTTLTSGSLVVANTSGSATGTGSLSVTAGTLGGSGIISGAVTLGTGNGAGAFLAPAHGTTTQTILTVQSLLNFNADATYTYTFKAKGKKAKTDKVIANGVTINSGASMNLSGQTQGTLKRGLALTAISNTSATPIAGTFGNLPDGAIVNVNGNNLQASYEGGDGNDLTLTVVP